MRSGLNFKNACCNWCPVQYKRNVMNDLTLPGTTITIMTLLQCITIISVLLLHSFFMFILFVLYSKNTSSKNIN